VDEILAVGDFKFQAKCFNKLGELKKQGVTIIIVSHNMNMISAFTDKAILLNKGKFLTMGASANTIDLYFKKIMDNKNMNIEQVQTGNELIKIYKVGVQKRKLRPLDSFVLKFFYESQKDYQDIDIDIAIYSSNDWTAYYRATNKAFKQKINIIKGVGVLEINIDSIPLQNCQGTVAISVWDKGRSELILWWRIPITFANKPFSTGKNYLQTTYTAKRIRG
jgi:ABC-type glutathione transport system ATPase component